MTPVQIAESPTWLLRHVALLEQYEQARAALSPQPQAPQMEEEQWA